MAEKSGFILYMDQYAPIAGLSFEQKGRLLDAFFRFNAGEEPALEDPLLVMAFAFFRQTFTRDSAKYELKCLKNRENSAKRHARTADASDGMRSDATAANQGESKPERNRRSAKPGSNGIEKGIPSASASPGAAPDAANKRGRSPSRPGGFRDDPQDDPRDGPVLLPDVPHDQTVSPPGDPDDVPVFPPDDPHGGPVLLPDDPGGGLSPLTGDPDGASQAAAPFYETRKKRRLSGRRLESFNRFWRAFAHAKGKAEAADAWLDIPRLTNALVDAIVAAAEREAAARPGLVAKGRSPKWAQGWLAARRWEDGDEEAASVPTLDEILRAQGL